MIPQLLQVSYVAITDFANDKPALAQTARLTGLDCHGRASRGPLRTSACCCSAGQRRNGDAGLSRLRIASLTNALKREKKNMSWLTLTQEVSKGGGDHMFSTIPKPPEGVRIDRGKKERGTCGAGRPAAAPEKGKSVCDLRRVSKFFQAIRESVCECAERNATLLFPGLGSQSALLLKYRQRGYLCTLFFDDSSGKISNMAAATRL